MSQSDPRRLLDDVPGPERELLEAWSTMRAPEGARLRAAALLAGGGAAVVAAAAKTSAASGAGAGGASGAAAVPMALATKLLTLATLAAVLAGSAFVLWPTSAPNATGTPSAQVAAPFSSPSLAPLAPLATATVAAAAAPELVAVPIGALPSAPASASGAAPRPVTAPAPSALSMQLVELDAIRAALAADERDQALAALDRFSAHHPGSPLAEEAAALRFDVQLARGDRAAASDAARRFLANYPESPYAARIRRASTDLP